MSQNNLPKATIYKKLRLNKNAVDQCPATLYTKNKVDIFSSLKLNIDSLGDHTKSSISTTIISNCDS